MTTKKGRCHSRLQRPRSFWSAPGIETSGRGLARIRANRVESSHRKSYRVRQGISLLEIIIQVRGCHIEKDNNNSVTGFGRVRHDLSGRVILEVNVCISIKTMQSYFHVKVLYLPKRYHKNSHPPSPHWFYNTCRHLSIVLPAL